MAGELKGSHKSSDILFDLTPEDDKNLRESDLLDLVNHGQLTDTIDIPGLHGSVYHVRVSLLWDDDYIDILKRTTNYSNDPILRVKLLRKLKLHTAISGINDKDYSDKNDPRAQRELWLILSRLSDTHIEYIDKKYGELEFTRNMDVMDAMQQITEKFDKTSPNNKEEDEQETNPIDEHVAMFQNQGQSEKKKPEDLKTNKSDKQQDDSEISKPTKQKVVSAKQNE
jgi:hypothetical protein